MRCNYIYIKITKSFSCDPLNKHNKPAKDEITGVFFVRQSYLCTITLNFSHSWFMSPLTSCCVFFTCLCISSVGAMKDGRSSYLVSDVWSHMFLDRFFPGVQLPPRAAQGLNTSWPLCSFCLSPQEECNIIRRRRRRRRRMRRTREQAQITNLKLI